MRFFSVPPAGTAVSRIDRFFWLLMAIAFGLGVYGWYQYESQIGERASFWLATYLTLQTFFLEVEFDENPSFPLNVVAFLAPFSLAGSILLYAIRLVRLRVRASWLRMVARNHIVVIGDTPQSRAFVESCPSRERIVYLVGPEPLRSAEIANLANVDVLFGDYSHMVKYGRLEHARAVLVFPPTPEALEQFAREIVQAYLTSAATQIRASFSIESGAMYEVFTEFSDVLTETYAGGRKHFAFSAFSLDDRLARSLALRVAPHHSVPQDVVLEGDLELIVHGFSRLVERFLLEAAHLYHFSPEHAVRITLITDDREAVARFCTRHPGVRSVIDLQVLPEDAFVQWGRGRVLPEMEYRPYRVVIFPTEGWDIPRLARNWRRILLQSFDDHSMRIPITCIIPFEEPLTEIYRVLEVSLEPIRIEVLSLRELLNFDLLIQNTEEIDSTARQIHEQYQEHHGGPAWEELSEWQKNFNRRSAAHLTIKLWFLGLELRTDEESSPCEIPEISTEVRKLLAQIEHRRWMAEKILDDFVHGRFPEAPQQRQLYKDHLRIHQDIRPFHELSVDDVRKDELTFVNMKRIFDRVNIRQRIVRTETRSTSTKLE